ncbi:hypothetical protein EDB81DRAFT_814482 [Dactylonectria macrodidyma]|uniref:F-box domain-containing protein n=1 Tax=Dactylonectria macrodidyma TaxID=307937 RepID=A0A9P9IG23_9HYPO|nr:hypothetical protein EDB81DRAFT_814482 [Dactylonectria macrodidyma]
MEGSKFIKIGRSPITHLPPEILESILCQLPNSDIKSLRATCIHLNQVVPLRLSRVFLSPNPVNVDVFRAIADHEIFRKNIIEIIYDDARFADSLAEGEVSVRDFNDDSDDYNDIGDVSGVPAWYLRQYRDNAGCIDFYGVQDVKRPHHIEVAERFKSRPSPAESYRLYQDLLRGQDQVIAANSDAGALRYGLSRFTNLQRITITPAAHGSPVQPLYQTPMIRSLPPGLIYPLPRGWPIAEEGENEPFAESWYGDEKSKWRGFCLVTSVAAQYFRENPAASIFEFVVDTNHLLTGISCRLFDDAGSPEYKDLVTILSQPGLSRIDMSLLVGGQDEQGWHAFRSGCLHRALRRAPGLQCVKLSTNLGDPENLDDPMATDGEDHWMPLRTIFPVEMWPNLRHFCLSRFIVKQADVVRLLLALPLTLQSVELSFLSFVQNSDHYQGLLEDMRSKLGWRERPATERPKIVIYGDHEPQVQEKPIDVSHEAENFLYGDGKNPFQRSAIASGTGLRVDKFDPNFERPNACSLDLMRLGIVEKDDWYRKHHR